MLTITVIIITILSISILIYGSLQIVKSANKNKKKDTSEASEGSTGSSQSGNQKKKNREDKQEKQSEDKQSNSCNPPCPKGLVCRNGNCAISIRSDYWYGKYSRPSIANNSQTRTTDIYAYIKDHHITTQKPFSILRIERLISPNGAILQECAIQSAFYIDETDALKDGSGAITNGTPNGIFSSCDGFTVLDTPYIEFNDAKTELYIDLSLSNNYTSEYGTDIITLRKVSK